MEDPTQQFQPLAESLLWGNVFEEAGARRDAEIAADPEWTTPKWHRVHRLLQAFVQGVLSADPWFKGYKAPPGLSSVIDWIAFRIQREWPGQEVIQVSLVGYKERIRKWAMEHPQFREWNECPGVTIAVTSRYSPTPEKRDFIDLDAVFQNAVVCLRDWTRRDEEFDKKFEAKYGKFSAHEEDEK